MTNLVLSDINFFRAKVTETSALQLIWKIVYGMAVEIILLILSHHFVNHHILQQFQRQKGMKNLFPNGKLFLFCYSTLTQCNI